MNNFVVLAYRIIKLYIFFCVCM